MSDTFPIAVGSVIAPQRPHGAVGSGGSIGTQQPPNITRTVSNLHLPTPTAGCNMITFASLGVYMPQLHYIHGNQTSQKGRRSSRPGAWLSKYARQVLRRLWACIASHLRVHVDHQLRRLCLDIAFACCFGVVFSFCAFTCKISSIAR
ncbi:hypothetical protein COCMIDRAFT_25152 [Bipolaris oryzae ATCC 44560]|uniref:Uncharacterized protein n=1 Tax=Bipolaris oryzae ATCC 44560 TaxID=930090 RepID=W6ZAX0_COCMI|nr:uncharacterized protein COCMIDRAFT_25152 [Bipolaris oryzae ATCC 44560]EUC46953.1 hypothetical protein COCMIDRAFT_25152 [Bipolaris oryzae ATCC 44560]